jgi:hypothetical protein
LQTIAFHQKTKSLDLFIQIFRKENALPKFAEQQLLELAITFSNPADIDLTFFHSLVPVYPPDAHCKKTNNLHSSLESARFCVGIGHAKEKYQTIVQLIEHQIATHYMKPLICGIVAARLPVAPTSPLQRLARSSLFEPRILQIVRQFLI